MTELAKGDAAPDFRLQNSSGEWVSLADYAGQHLIVYFYPAALTAGCTLEAVDFSAAAADLRQAGYTVIGISPDEPATLARFAETNSLDITLLADPERTTIKTWGAWGDRVIWGKTITGVLRSTFVVTLDQQGHGHIDDAQYNVRATGHVQRLRTKLGL